MNVLVDSNVLISAALRDGLPERVVQYVATHDDCRWIATPEILDEYVMVLRRPKFHLSSEVLQDWTSLVRLRTITIPSPPIGLRLPRDPTDEIFLAAAVASQADYLITGDKDLLQSRLMLRTRILTPAEFAAEVGIS
jgi:putative PIN family toxin of toxin-antitoxin system